MNKAEQTTQTGVYETGKWLEIWRATDKPGWHRDAVDMYLQKYLHLLTEDRQSISILVTWCGKSLDLLWLAEQGHTVVGVELSEIAVAQFFQENNLEFSSTDKANFRVYTASKHSITIFCGSMYDFTPGITGCKFDAIWDHHALGANNPADRKKHIEVLCSVLKPQGQILLSHFEYDPTEHTGPPFSLPPSLIQELFKEHFQVKYLESVEETDNPTAKKFNLTWLKRPLHLLKKLN